MRDLFGVSRPLWDEFASSGRSSSSRLLTRSATFVMIIQMADWTTLSGSFSFLARLPVLHYYGSCILLTAALLVPGSLRAAEPSPNLAQQLKPICVALARDQVAWTATIEIEIDGRPQRVDASFARFSGQSFDLKLTHADYALELRRRDDATALALPKHNVVYVGRGKVDGDDHLAPAKIAQRLVSNGSLVSLYVPLAAQSDPNTLHLLLTGLLKVKYSADDKRWLINKDISFQVSAEKVAIDVRADSTKVHLQLVDKLPAEEPIDEWPGQRIEKLDRAELERTLARGVRRACEVLAPSPLLTNPEQVAKKIENGELRWIDGQRVVLLRGTPEQVGRAHGQLLKVETQRCIDSVIHSFGTVQTIRTGRWFRHELEAAYKRLSPHIPVDHKRETIALAEALNMDSQLAQTINVFPELFHCSGFAVFGKATKGGKLYHGRVLDYMTTIGLQDSATTFVIAIDGKIPFVNVGYGGFIGSVSGMNAKAISLGEMGGRGEGKWNGAPMATLMRRALEECSTLDDVMTLWKNSPRTCEYYYVFADGKTNRAVGVAATPENIEFVLPGQAHPLLGEGIPDTVVLSAGDRLEKLRSRVKERYGQLDAEGGQWLMCRPVAMESNLHNVLFVPEDGVLYVANANHELPAAERPYVKLDLKQLLGEMTESK